MWPRLHAAALHRQVLLLKVPPAAPPAMPARATEKADVESVSVSGYPTTQPHQNGIPETLSMPHSRPLPRGLVPDAHWPGMYRVRQANGTLGDLLNLTRAHDLLRIMEDAA